MEYKNLVKDFAKRTLENNKIYNGKYEVTNLINSSLGLFIFPEQNFFDKILNEWVSPELLDELITNTESTYEEPINLKNICKHIRNGIAHFRLKLMSNNSKEITEIIISDHFLDRQSKKSYDFKIKISIENLERLYFEFSEAIINN